MKTLNHIHVHTSNEIASAQYEALQLNNKGQQLFFEGRHEEALIHFKEALRLKITAHGTHSVHTALSYNALGECYLDLKQYDLAREHLENALSYRKTQGETLDTRITRDNLGRVCEEMGDVEGAREYRKNGTNLCSFPNCSSPPPPRGQKLKTCSRCAAIFYCSAVCQKSDWKRHKEYCEKLARSIQK